MIKNLIKNLLIAVVFATSVVLILSFIAILIVESVPYTGNLLFYLFMGVGLYFIIKHWRD